jgi:SAM-dependent methyltransferase
MNDKDYIEFNRLTYDDAATEFREKISIRAKATERLVGRFLRFATGGGRILELGPGSGYALKLISELGYDATAIELSGPMAQIAQSTAPQAKVITGEFLSHDFGRQKFDGIYACAFVHLFSEDDVMTVLEKINNLLHSGGIALISTTKHEKSSEGYFEKVNFRNRAKRFRHRYTKDELKNRLNETFDIIDYTEDVDSRETPRVWMNFIVKKRN